MMEILITMMDVPQTVNLSLDFHAQMARLPALRTATKSVEMAEESWTLVTMATPQTEMVETPHATQSTDTRVLEEGVTTQTYDGKHAEMGSLWMELSMMNLIIINETMGIITMEMGVVMCDGQKWDGLVQEVMRLMLVRVRRYVEME